VGKNGEIVENLTISEFIPVVIIPSKVSIEPLRKFGFPEYVPGVVLAMNGLKSKD
jgi:hypothetical protein